MFILEGIIPLIFPELWKETFKKITKFNDILSSTAWDEILTSDDPDVLCKTFYRILTNAYERCFPLVRLSRKKAKDKPWITKGLRTSINHKNKLYSKQKQTNKQ